MSPKFQQLVPLNGQVWPKARSGHRMCADENHLYIFGGYNPTNLESKKTFNELWKYNTTTGSWGLLPDVEGLAPTSCASSSMVLVGSNIIVFGGTGFPFSWTNTNGLFMYSLKMERWFDLNLETRKKNSAEQQQQQPNYKLKPCGCMKVYDVPPVPKYGQAMIAVQNKLFIHSGTKGEEFTRELHGYSLKSFRWVEYKLCEQHGRDEPTPRYRHEVVATDNGFVILGGATLDSCFDFDKLESFSFSPKRWERLHCNSSVFPEGRKAHSCVLHDGTVYMVGGLNLEMGLMKDVWSLDLASLKWNPNKKLEFPYPVQFHSSAVVQSGCLYVFGGVRDDSLRVSDLHRLWLRVPPLKRLAWMKIVDVLRISNNLNRKTLLDLKIPKYFLEFIESHQEVVAA